MRRTGVGMHGEGSVGLPSSAQPTKVRLLFMLQPIVGYHQDEEGHYVARLACGHNQHVRHTPPWQNRPWVVSESGRDEHLGTPLNCRKCEEGAPRDWV